MLRHRVLPSAVLLHGVELTGLLFADYIQSSLFRMDVVEALCNVDGFFTFFRGGFQPTALLHFYTRLISERLLFRLLECGMTTVCMCSGSDFCRDAIAFHYIFPIVRDYRYARFGLTRMLRCVGHFLSPNLLRRRSGGSGSSAAVAAASRRKESASISAAPKLFARGNDSDAEMSFYRNPPRPSRAEPFEGMPESCRDALRYYLYVYQTRPYYTAFVSGFISDVSLFTAEQIMWYTLMRQEHRKPTSKWRLGKPYLSDLAVIATQTVLVYGARVAGIMIGRRVSREPTGGGIFWGEHLTLLALSPAINYVSMRIGFAVREALERRHPRTVEDEMEDKRVEEEAEAAARAQAAAAKAAFSFMNGSSGVSDAGGHAAGGASSRPSSVFGSSPNSRRNYYEVLGVTEQANVPEIKKAYRAKALQHHPDRACKDSTAQQHARDQMSIINEAYDTLVDADKRMQYDAARSFADGYDLLKKLESMSTAQLVVVGTGAIAGLSALAVMSAYGQYMSVFQRVTSLGRGPLQLFA